MLAKKTRSTSELSCQTSPHHRTGVFIATKRMISLLFALSLAFVAADEPIAIPVPNPSCTNWEEASAKYNEAVAKWVEPECYVFTYTFRGFTIGGPDPQTRQVRNGTAINLTDEQEQMYFKTLQDFFDLINDLCIERCPGDGAFVCDITYSEASGVTYPSSIFIDVSQLMADEERIYDITDVSTVDCTTGFTDFAFLKEDKCIGYDQLKESIEANTWEEPSCYLYLVGRGGRVTPEYAGPFQVEVRDGIATVVDGSPQEDIGLTIEDWMELVRSQCLAGCVEGDPGDPAYECRVSFDETLSYPTEIYIDKDVRIADEELYYVLQELRMCSDETDQELPSEEETVDCTAYTQLESDWSEASETWSNAPCYSYSFQRIGEIPDEEMGPFKVSVISGESTNVEIQKTFEDYMELIRGNCFASCPDAVEDLADSCQIEYESETGFPTKIFIDHDAGMADEETWYEFSNITIDSSCSTNTVDTAYCQAIDAGLVNAREAWSLVSSACDSVILEPLSNETASVRSKNLAGTKMSVGEAYDFISDQCLDGCPGESATSACSVEYDGAGVPTTMGMTYADDDKVMFEVRVECDVEKPDQNETTDGTVDRSQESGAFSPRMILSILSYVMYWIHFL